ncbi:hypothetical protein ACRS3X_25785 [Ectopseudomonas hydrolytica]|uniref:hypothetical protein n=1 Tax=Ectopseudomonas hydrolytica TaxID=2493633 RepID=UPI003EE21EAE
MNSLRITVCATLIALLSGCANETPLMFMSKTIIGVEVASPSAGGSETGLSLGFKAIDTAYIPVVEIIDPKKQQLNVVSSSDLTAAPPPQTRTQEETQADKELALAMSVLASQIAEESTKITSEPSDARTQAITNLNVQRVALEELSKARDSLPGRRDALSVFSVIDTNSFARSSEAGVGVGKIFATGLAAQYAAENYRPPYNACSREIVQAAVTLQKSESEADRKLADALVEMCPAKK